MTARFLKLLRGRRDRENIYNQPDFWDGKAQDYQDSAVSMFANRNLNALIERQQFAFMDTVLPDVSGRHVMDLGAGTGRLSRHLARRGAQVSSFDFAPAVVEIARKLNGDLPIDAQVMSVFDLDAEAAFDDATVLGCLTVACTTPAELADVARRLWRAVRPGGRIAMIEPFHKGFLHRVLDLHVDDAVAVFEAAGFTATHRAEITFAPVRFGLSPVEFPSWMTTPLYSAGEAFMKLGGAKSGWGDYKCIGLRRGDTPA